MVIQKEKTLTSKWMSASPAILIFLIIVSMFIYQNPVSDDKWCERLNPRVNLSDPQYSFSIFTLSNRAEYCYGEGWETYCEISYPQYCPNNDYTDKERCLMKCEEFGVSECSC